MMITEPRLEDRSEQPYVGIRSEVMMEEISAKLPPLIGEVQQWLADKGIATSGPALFRYLDFHEGVRMTIDVAFPVAQKVDLSGNRRFIVDVLPAGRYAIVKYVGDYATLYQAHSALMDWGKGAKIEFEQSAMADGGEQWGARIEFYITDPMESPDPATWETEVAFLTVLPVKA